MCDIPGTTPTERTFDLAFGQAIHRHRTATGATQEDLARSARALGLNWKANTVTQLESGRRHWQPVEMLLAPFILAGVSPRGWYEAPTLPELLAELEPVEPGYDGRTLANLATGRASAPDPGAGTGAFLREAGEYVDAQLGEAERKAAHRYYLDTNVMLEAARFLWARSLTEEREARLAIALRDDPGADRRTLRSNITRDLLTAITERIAENASNATGGEQHGAR